MSTFVASAWSDSAAAISHYLLPVALVIGAGLCLAGSRLVRALCAALGLLLGVFCGLVAGAMGSGILAIVIVVIIGTLAGFLASFVLFRLGMGISLALVLALLAPLYSLVLSGKPLPPIVGWTAATQSAQAADDSSPFAADDQSADDEWAAEQAATQEAPGATGSATLEKVRAVGNKAWQQGSAQFGLLRTWWQAADSSQQVLLVSLAGLGVGAGLVVGMFFPLLAAAIQSSLLGAAILMWGTAHLLVQIHPAPVPTPTPLDPVTLLITLALLTMAGVLLQSVIWGESGKKPKKERDEEQE